MGQRSLSRHDFPSVVEVRATPAFVEPGTPVAISARLLNAVNHRQNIRVACTVRNADGHVVFAPPPPDFENPSDADRNNVYVVIVQVRDGSPTDRQTILVTVTDVNEPTGLFAHGVNVGLQASW